MRVIPVLDILGGRAVHARAGDRDSYAPLSSYLAPGRPGDALAIARAFRDRLGFDELYLADLDAILGRLPQRALRRAIAMAGPWPGPQTRAGTGTGAGAETGPALGPPQGPGVRTWIDAGVTSAPQVRELLDDRVERVIIGLETLPTRPDPRAALRELTAAAGLRAVFSLDLRAGRPMTTDPAFAALSPLAIAELAAEAGVPTIIVLDIARVGTASGVDLVLVRAIRRALPGIELVAGGGVRGVGDLERLSDSGADAALVGSALHDEFPAQGSGFWTRGTLSSETSPFDT